MAAKIYNNSAQCWLQDTQFNHSINSIENKMIQDGYTNAAAGAIRNKAWALLRSDIKN